jgi:peroxiredoxin
MVILVLQMKESYNLYEKIIILSLLIFVRIALYSQEAKKTFTINGNIEGDYNGMIYLRSSALKNINDSCLVVDNKFKFIGKLEASAKVSLTLKPTSTVAFFYLENSSIDLTIATSVFKNGTEDINDIEIKKVSGSKTNDLMTLIDEYQKKIEKSELSIEEKNNKIYKKYFETVIENPEYPVLDLLLKKPKKDQFLSADQISDLMLFAPIKKKVEIEKVKDTLKINNKTVLSNKLKIGKKMENFSLPNQLGNSVSIEDYKGKVVLINFWASWYKPTRKNNAELIEIYSKYKNKDFEIVSISIDTFADNWIKAIEKGGLTWINLIEIGGWHGKVTNQFEIKGIPLNILLDKEGKIIAVNSTSELLIKKLDFLLNIDSNN